MSTTRLRRFLAAGLLLPLTGYAASVPSTRDAGSERTEDSMSAAMGTTLYLEVSLDGRPTHTIVSFLEGSTGLLIQQRDLSSLGLRLPSVGRAAQAAEWVNLNAIAGLQYRLNRARQTIDLRAADDLRAPLRIGQMERSVPKAATATGLVVNYDALGQRSSFATATSSIAVSSEQRLFSPLGILSNTGIARCCADHPDYIRASTYYQYDDPATLTTVQAGDALTSSLSWSRPVRFAGLQWRRNFALDPQLITFPMPQLAGSAALPSTVDLYVNNMRQYSAEVPAGPFVIDHPIGLTGAGLATLIVRDEFGRAVSTSLPIYVDSRLLAQGLSSYSLEAGALRYGYGLQSSEYAGHAAFSGTYRYGISERLTLEGHGEASGALLSSGLGALLQVGDAGVLHTASAGSTDRDGAGAQYLLGYQLILPLVTISAQSVRASGHYRDLASLGAFAPARRTDQVSASTVVGGRNTLGMSYLRLDDRFVGHSEIWSAWCSASLGGTASAFLSVSEERARSGSAVIWVGLSAALGERTSGSSDFADTGGHTNYGVSAVRSAQYSGGWEWALQARRAQGSTSSFVRAGYLGQYGEIAATANTIGGHTELSIEDLGSLVVMDGTVEAARRIGAGFAMVSTNGVAGVPVLHENRLIGLTDSSGHLLVPELNPYDRNSVSIDALTLPTDAKIPLDRQELIPRGNSGVLADFH